MHSHWRVKTPTLQATARTGCEYSAQYRTYWSAVVFDGLCSLTLPRFSFISGLVCLRGNRGGTQRPGSLSGTLLVSNLRHTQTTSRLQKTEHCSKGSVWPTPVHWTSWLWSRYLSEGFAGEATEFPLLNISVTPKAGRLLLWRNADHTGVPDPRTLHAGAPVESGTKYACNIWVLERPFELYRSAK